MTGAVSGAAAAGQSLSGLLRTGLQKGLEDRSTRQGTAVCSTSAYPHEAVASVLFSASRVLVLATITALPLPLPLKPLLDSSGPVGGFTPLNFRGETRVSSCLHGFYRMLQ